jgi:hypothetical protein
MSRFSKDTLNNLGSSKQVKITNGVASVTYSNSTGMEPSLPADAGEVIADPTMLPGAINVHNYYALYGYLEGRSKSAVYASTMASVLLDAAKMKGIPAYTLIDSVKRGDLASVAQFYPEINALRSPSDQQEITSNINNSNSIKFRNINP